MNDNNKSITGYRIYFIVWICLLILTATTVAISNLKLGKYGALISLFIASIKASLILLFFMHLKYEGFLIKAMLLLTIMTIAIIVGLTFSDVWYRH
ncbi:MAG: cytochrome C oxidase subunit IV family protein [Nitrospirae bacterium]|nr:cytochrome C oxidase subunit IV family protein [Nitrospirota bacterium]